MSANTKKWLAIFALAVLCAMLETMTEKGAGLFDYMKHAAFSLLPGLAGLKTTLERAVGMPPDPPKSNAAAV